MHRTKWYEVLDKLVERYQEIYEAGERPIPFDDSQCEIAWWDDFVDYIENSQYKHLTQVHNDE